jgi:hypothetical protein
MAPGCQDLQESPRQTCGTDTRSLYNMVAMAIRDVMQQGVPVRGGGQCAPPRPMTNGCESDYCGSPQGVRAVAVPANTTVDIRVTPNYGFTPATFVYTGPGETFTIDRVQVGERSPVQSVTPADAYAARANAVSIPAQWGRFEPWRAMVFTVTNTTAAAATFDGALFGVLHITEARQGG